MRESETPAGGCLTARDLARYFSIFVRRGLGVDGKRVGSTPFIEQTLSSGVPMTPPNEGIRYCNQTMVSGRSLGHGGWGGQYALANLDNGVFERLGRYEAAIARQVLKTLYLLQSVRAR